MDWSHGVHPRWAAVYWMLWAGSHRGRRLQWLWRNLCDSRWIRRCTDGVDWTNARVGAARYILACPPDEHAATIPERQERIVARRCFVVPPTIDRKPAHFRSPHDSRNCTTFERPASTERVGSYRD